MEDKEKQELQKQIEELRIENREIKKQLNNAPYLQTFSDGSGEVFIRDIRYDPMDAFDCQ